MKLTLVISSKFIYLLLILSFAVVSAKKDESNTNAFSLGDPTYVRK